MHQPIIGIQLHDGRTKNYLPPHATEGKDVSTFLDYALLITELDGFLLP